MKTWFRSTAACLALATISLPAFAAGDRAVILIYDASGSMWAEMGTSTRVETARKVLDRFLTTRDASVPLGAIAYGHRRRGDCQDIEVIAPVRRQDAALSARLNAISPIGKTPIGASLRLAASQIPRTSEEADIVLITDGLETCGVDPCEVANELASQGIKIRAHVVGFGMSLDETDQLSCIAEATGGKIFSAQDATELQGALMSTAAAPPPLPQAALTAPDTAARGATISVSWQGPNRAGDYIDIVDFDGAGAKAYETVVLAEQGPLEIQMPAETGPFVLRYVQPMTSDEAQAVNGGTTERTLATRLITVVEGGEIIEAPQTVLQSALIEVAVTQDVPAGSYIGVFPAETLGVDGWSAAADLGSGMPVQLQVPIEPGAYELRLIIPGSGASFDVAAARPISILPAAIEMSAPAQVAAGSSFDVTWSGPVAGENWFDLTEVGETAIYGYEGYTTYSYAYVGTGAPATLTAPDMIGRYEIRYVASVPVGQGNGAERAILASKTIDVLADLPTQPVSEPVEDLDQTEMPPVTTPIPVEGQDVDQIVSELFKQ